MNVARIFLGVSLCFSCVGFLGMILTVQLFGHGVDQPLPEARAARKRRCVPDPIIFDRQDVLGTHRTEQDVDLARPALRKRILQ